MAKKKSAKKKAKKVTAKKKTVTKAAKKKAKAMPMKKAAKAVKKKAAKKSATKKPARKKARRRELIDTGTDKRYVRRDAGGRFDEVVDVGRSLAADRRQQSETPVGSGFGDMGDRPSGGSVFSG